MNYRIGLDIGIGSVGWSVVSAEENGHSERIEDFGTRIFGTGEDPKKKVSLCQGRRTARGVRRLERRRSNRKKLLENHFNVIGLVNPAFYDDLAEITNADVYEMKLHGIDGVLSPAELFKCLVHTCNHRGYSSFYESENEIDDEDGKNASAANAFENGFRESNCRIVSEYLLKQYKEKDFIKFKNRSDSTVPYLLISRNLLREETELILQKQKQYYPELTEENIRKTIEIIFSQRDFEDGPGDPNDPTRRYHGFLETLGQCPYYKDEVRGFRGTVISDVFAVTNTLSQYKFINKSTGEYELNPAVAKTLVSSLLENANLTMTEVKKILKANGYELMKSEKSDDKALSKAIKYLHLAKKCVDDAGLDWSDMIGEEQFDLESESVLHKIGELISKYQTPARRKKEMKAAGISPELIASFANKKNSGTSSVSYRFMCDSIHAFMEGDIYGNFQSDFIKKHEVDQPVQKSVKLESKHIDDPEVRENRVVFKAINETRKIVNAIIEEYGSPEAIVIEVASELGKSALMREEEDKRKKANEKENETVKKEISVLLGIEVSDVKGAMIERYKLHKEQEGKCAYSGKPLGELKYVVKDDNREYEIDHIVPYSLILDNTLNNKALVFAGENQKKGQRTPLMYLNAEKRDAFLAFVNHLYSRKVNPISKKKLQYYKLETIYSDEAQTLLSDWKSRNINDTRYITKYIAGLFERYLVFVGDKKQHVYTVKGAVSQKFRREWFNDSVWGRDDKDRSTNLNHALDATVVANLTKPYIEIGSDALRLIAIYKKNKSRVTPEYEQYLEECVRKMKKYYGFDEEYTRTLLSKKGRVPSYVPDLKAQVEARFIDDDEQKFKEQTSKVYQNDPEFAESLRMPVTSHKSERKFQGCIADDNPIKLVEINGEYCKIKRKSIKQITAKDLDKLYTNDTSLKEQLSEIFVGVTDEKYTVEKYLSDNSFDRFLTKGGTEIRKVSVIDGKVSNYYKKNISDDNYTILGMPKYYCVEVYKDAEGNTKTCGLRFVDVVKKNGKLYRKEGTLPEDYDRHVMYLFANDYIKVFDKNGNMKFSGFYKSVYNINESRFYFLSENGTDTFVKGISNKDTVKKYDISILGKIGGEIRCSEPLQCIGEKKSQ